MIPPTPATTAAYSAGAPAATSASTKRPAPLSGVTSALVQLEREPGWQHATLAQRAVLRRIAAQRDKRMLERLLREQERLQRAAAQEVDPQAPLHQKLATFARLHPSVTAAVATSVALMIGPRRLARVGRSVLPALLPLLSKMRSSK